MTKIKYSYNIPNAGENDRKLIIHMVQVGVQNDTVSLEKLSSAFKTNIETTIQPSNCIPGHFTP